MAYFSNGTEGMDFENNVCGNCRHGESEDESHVCPVMHIHAMFNYEQWGNAKLNQVLEMLVPRDTDGFSRKCEMFLIKDNPDVKGQMLIFKEGS